MADQIVIYGANWCADCHASRSLLDSKAIAYDYKDIDSDPKLLVEMLKLTDGKNIIPTIVLDGTILLEPSNTELLTALNLKETPLDIPTHDVIIVGAGPAALAAAIYTTREDIETLLFERGVVGGLAAVTDKIDNYPGFPDGIEGLTLADDLRKQAERFGLIRQELREQARKADRFAAQVRSHERGAFGRGIAFVEDEVNGREHSGEPVGKLFLGGHDVGNARFGNFFPGTHQALCRRRFGLKEGASDLARGQSAQRAQRERHLRRLCQRRMAAGKYQPQAIVGH